MTTVATRDNADLSAPAATSVAPLLAKLAAGVGAVALVAYQAWFMPYFQVFFAGREGLARLVFYGLYGSVLAVTLLALATRPDIRPKIAPFAIAAIIAVAAVALHPVGLVARAYVIAIILGGAVVVLILAAGPVGLLRLSAAITALNAILCFCDLLFADGFTNSLGRAAGLAINPNGAAAALLLGTAATYRAVPDRLRPSFLVLAGAGIVITLSRSNILTAIVVVAITLAAMAWQRWRTGEAPPIPRTGLRLAALTAAVIALWIAAGLTVNDRARGALRGSVADILSAGDAIEAAQKAVKTSPTLPPAAPMAAPAPAPAASTPAPAAAPTMTPPAPVSAPAVTAPAPPVAPAPAARPSDVRRIDAIGDRLAGEGQRNTISARTLFLERALLAYRNGGFFGIGLEAAQGLAPHNTFLLFALAFGHLGWLIPLALVGLAFHAARDLRDLPVGLATLGAMLTSHDTLLSPSLFLSIAVGIAGMLAGRERSGPAARITPAAALGTVLAAALFAVGCLAIVSYAPSRAVDELDLRPYHGAYLATLGPTDFPGILPRDGARRAQNDGPSVHEDSGTLTRVAWTFATPAVAPGQYSLRDDSLVALAPSDGSDPRQNGRRYEVDMPLVVGPLFYILLGAIVLWSGAIALVAFAAPAGRRP